MNKVAIERFALLCEDAMVLEAYYLAKGDFEGAAFAAGKAESWSLKAFAEAEGVL